MFEPDGGMVAKTIADQIYRQIRGDIVSGALPPGTKLAMEMLTKRYGVGMSPLREALARLTGDTLVYTEGQRGFWVSHVSVEKLNDTMKTRVLIETEALTRSIELGDAAWEERVKQSYAVLSSLEDRLQNGGQAIFDQWERANRQFHEALVSACDSEWLIHIWRMLYQHSERYRTISLSNKPASRDVHDEHEAIMNAVLERRALRACRLLEIHVQRTMDVVRNALLSRASELPSQKRQSARSKSA